MKFRIALFVVASVLLAAAQDAAPDTQVGNFLYHMPNGWTPEEKGDTTILHAPSPPPGTATFIAMAADNMEGDLQNSFNQLWTGFKNSYRILQGGQISPLHSNHGYDAFTTTAVASDQNGVRWTVYVMGAQYKQRIQTVMFMSNVPQGTMLNAYYKRFQEFLASLSFGDTLPGSRVPPVSSGPGEETPHKLAPGALEGIYVGFGLSAGGHASAKPLLFSADGWVVKNIPDEGMIGFDFTANRNNPNTNRSWVGRYRVDGNQINILWQDYTNDRQVIQRNETSASPGLDVYVPMCRCTGKKFSGKYNFGLPGASQYMQFFPDGTFVDHRVLDQLIAPSSFYNNPRIQRGSYSIQSQTMIFTFADGRRAMRIFYAPKAQEKGQVFDFINLGGHDMYEEHYQAQP